MSTNKTACVTGTDRGIGLAITKSLLQKGYTVYAGGIMETNAEMDLLAEQFPNQLHAFVLDVGFLAKISRLRVRRTTTVSRNWIGTNFHFAYPIRIAGTEICHRNKLQL